MSEWEKTKKRLQEQFEREGVIVGTPESLARELGFTTRDVEQALASLVDENMIQPFQDDEGQLGYQWKPSYTQ